MSTYKTLSNSPEIRLNSFNSLAFWDNVFTDDELTLIENYCSTLQLENGKHVMTTADSILSAGPEFTFRKSKVAFFNKNLENAWIFNKINEYIEKINNEYFNYDLNGYSYMQYSEYDETYNGKYDYHMDAHFGEDLSSTMHGQIRKLSIGLLLNDPDKDFVGGEFLINLGDEKKSNKVFFKKGRIIAFPSFIIHKVCPVTKGKRKSLVIWVEGPKFI